MSMYQPADPKPRQVLLPGSPEPSYICGHSLWVGAGKRSWAASDLWAWHLSISFPALFGFFTWLISCLFRSYSSHLCCPGLSVQTPCAMLALYFLHLTGTLSPSLSFPNWSIFLCLRFFLPLTQTITKWILFVFPAESCLCTLGCGTECIHQTFLVTQLGHHPEFIICFLSCLSHLSFLAPRKHIWDYFCISCYICSSKAAEWTPLDPCSKKNNFGGMGHGKQPG